MTARNYGAPPDPVKREGFATSLGVIAATLGSAVGLGNIWKFPYMTGENGGAVWLRRHLVKQCPFRIPAF